MPALAPAPIPAAVPAPNFLFICGELPGRPFVPGPPVAGLTPAELPGLLPALDTALDTELEPTPAPTLVPPSASSPPPVAGTVSCCSGLSHVVGRRELVVNSGTAAVSVPDRVHEGSAKLAPRRCLMVLKREGAGEGVASNERAFAVPNHVHQGSVKLVKLAPRSCLMAFWGAWGDARGSGAAKRWRVYPATLGRA